VGSVFGLATASVIHAVAAAFDLAALFMDWPLAFAVITYCGAGYLIYLGITGFRAGGIIGLAGPGHGIPAPFTRQGVSSGGPHRSLKPQAALFFFSFLLQFVDPAGGSPRLRMLFVGLLFQVTGVPTNLIVALAGGSVAGLLARNPFLGRACSAGFRA
jgi:threonine/homoserine/homoserine lactone efflux protein